MQHAPPTTDPAKGNPPFVYGLLHTQGYAHERNRWPRSEWLPRHVCIGLLQIDNIKIKNSSTSSGQRPS